MFALRVGHHVDGRRERTGDLPMAVNRQNEATEDEALEAWIKQELETKDVSPAPITRSQRPRSKPLRRPNGSVAEGVLTDMHGVNSILHEPRRRLEALNLSLRRRRAV